MQEPILYRILICETTHNNQEIYIKLYELFTHFCNSSYIDSTVDTYFHQEDGPYLIAIKRNTHHQYKILECDNVNLDNIINISLNNFDKFSDLLEQNCYNLTDRIYKDVLRDSIMIDEGKIILLNIILHPLGLIAV